MDPGIFLYFLSLGFEKGACCVVFFLFFSDWDNIYVDNLYIHLLTFLPTSLPASLPLPTPYIQVYRFVSRFDIRTTPRRPESLRLRGADGEPLYYYRLCGPRAQSLERQTRCEGRGPGVSCNFNLFGETRQFADVTDFNLFGMAKLSPIC